MASIVNVQNGLTFGLGSSLSEIPRIVDFLFDTEKEKKVKKYKREYEKEIVKIKKHI